MIEHGLLLMVNGEPLQSTKSLSLKDLELVGAEIRIFCEVNRPKF
jgi:hypothetical protein